MDITSETPKSISDWATQTFGPSPLLNIGIRGFLEVAEMVLAFRELHESLEAVDRPISERTRELALNARGEVVDVWIMASQIGYRSSVPFPTAGAYTCSSRFHSLALPLEVAAMYAKLLTNLEAQALAYPSLMIQVHLGLLRLFWQVERLLEPTRTEYDEAMFYAAVTEKMRVNRARKWVRTAAGNMQHAEAGEPSSSVAAPPPVASSSSFTEPGTGVVMKRNCWYILSDSGSAYSSLGFATSKDAQEFIRADAFRDMYGSEIGEDVTVANWDTELKTWTEPPASAINIVYGEHLYQFWQENPLEQRA